MEAGALPRAAINRAPPNPKNSSIHFALFYFFTVRSSSPSFRNSLSGGGGGGGGVGSSGFGLESSSAILRYSYSVYYYYKEVLHKNTQIPEYRPILTFVKFSHPCVIKLAVPQNGLSKFLT